MAITHKRFNKYLDDILSATIRILKKQNPGEYAITVFIVTRDTVHIQALIPLDDENNDVYAALRGFGKKFRGAVGPPLAVFVAAEAISDSDSECILITGCTPDKRTNAASITIARDSTNDSCTIDAKPIYYSARGAQVSKQRNPAAMVMEALLGWE